MREPIDLIENADLESTSATKTNYRRGILRIFTKWNKEPLTAKRIHQLLEEEGHYIKMDTLYDNLETLIKRSILQKIPLPSNGKRERPSYEYRLRKEAIYELFKLTEDLVDAMGFAEVGGEPGNAYVTKLVIEQGKELHSLRTPPQSGELAEIVRLAKEEDFEKTWRLARHIEELNSYCNTDSPAYKEYGLKKQWEHLCKRNFLPAWMSWEDYRDGIQNAEKSENGKWKNFRVSKPGKPALVLNTKGPLRFFKERESNPKAD